MYLQSYPSHIRVILGRRRRRRAAPPCTCPARGAGSESVPSQIRVALGAGHRSESTGVDPSHRSSESCPGRCRSCSRLGVRTTPIRVEEGDDGCPGLRNRYNCYNYYNNSRGGRHGMVRAAPRGARPCCARGVCVCPSRNPCLLLLVRGASHIRVDHPSRSDSDVGATSESIRSI